MPLFDVIGLGGEKHAVVIDIGAAYTKDGPLVYLRGI